MTTLTETTTHAQREAQAYSQAMDAARRGDRKEFGRLWAQYAQIHAQRPAAVVEAMETAKGLA
jgi:hypothetical protein